MVVDREFPRYCTRVGATGATTTRSRLHAPKKPNAVAAGSCEAPVGASACHRGSGEKCSGSTRRLVMRRRDFLTLLGAAVAWPRPVIGQSPSKVCRVGLLSAGAPIADNSSQGAALIRGFTQHGYKLGW